MAPGMAMDAMAEAKAAAKEEPAPAGGEAPLVRRAGVARDGGAGRRRLQVRLAQSLAGPVRQRREGVGRRPEESAGVLGGVLLDARQPQDTLPAVRQGPERRAGVGPSSIG